MHLSIEMKFTWKIGFGYLVWVSKSNINERNETKSEIEVQIESKTIQQLHIEHWTTTWASKLGDQASIYP